MDDEQNPDVRAAQAIEDCVAFDGRAADSWAEFRTPDAGVGISREHHARLLNSIDKPQREADTCSRVDDTDCRFIEHRAGLGREEELRLHVMRGGNHGLVRRADA